MIFKGGHCCCTVLFNVHFKGGKCKVIEQERFRFTYDSELFSQIPTLISFMKNTLFTS